MTTFVTNCARCGTKKSTHDCHSSNWIRAEYGWQNFVEVFAVCRTCHRSSIYVLSQRDSDEKLKQMFRQTNGLLEYSGSLNDLSRFEGVVSKLDWATNNPPDHLPEQLERIVREGNTCLSANCWNAAAAMYRLALDIVTKSLLPDEGEPNSKIRRNLGLRLPWLFKEGLLPLDLEKLAECLQQDGNDGAHDGSLQKEDAEDLYDFCYELLRRLITEPQRLKNAEERRAERRANKNYK